MAVNGETNGVLPVQKVMFWDIDNCCMCCLGDMNLKRRADHNARQLVYPKSYKIHHIMGDLIDKYFQTHLSLTPADARELHLSYYKDYGLAIEGLVRHHKIDPLEYNEKVDDALPLDDVIKPNPKLRKLLEDVDRSKVKMWLFTNAYVTHGRRVVKLLEIEDLFDGITYCDYGAPKLLCKPTPEMYAKAMREAGVTDSRDCYYVGK